MDAVKKVLYLSYDGLTDPLGQSQVLPYLVHLAKKGYRFTLLSFEKRARLQKEGALIQRIVDDAGIRWVPLSFTTSPPVLSKIWDRHQMWSTALRLHKKERFALIHCRSYVAAEVGLKLKQRFGVKFLFDMRGFWADEKVDNGQWNLQSPLFKKIYAQYKKREKEFLLHADGIISLTAAARDHLLSQEAYRNISIDVIPCCADLQHFDYNRIDPVKRAQLQQELDLASYHKVLTYLGSVGGWYMTKEMFGFFRKLKERYPEYKMLLLTKDDPQLVKAEAAALGISAVDLIVTYSDRNTLPLYLSLSTCSVFFIRNTYSKIASSPTKHAELMGMGIPVLCNDIGDTGNIIRETATGALLNTFDDASYEGAIEGVPQLEALSASHIRQCALDIFDLHKGVEKYFSVYTRMVGSD